MTITSAYTETVKRVLILATAGLLVLGSVALLSAQANAVACPPQTTDYGTVTATVEVPAAATYRVWTHIKTADVSNNTYLLDIDSKDCFNIGGTGIQANTWQWIAHRDASTSTKADVALTQGRHTLKLIGNKAGVKIDRIVLAADLGCTPSGNGDNCNTPKDTTMPSVQLSAPASNSTVSGTIAVTATASDNTSVTKVQFSVNDSVIAVDTTAPYSASLNTSAYMNGSYTIAAEAFDSAGNTSKDDASVSIQNGDKQTPSVPANVVAAAKTYNSAVISWSASTDNIGIKNYTVIRDGVPIAESAGTSFSDSGLLPNTTYSYQVMATDTAGNRSAASAKALITTPTVPDTQAPTVPVGLKAVASSKNQINLTWNASTDNIGIAAYDVFRGTQKIASIQTTSYGDTNLTANTSYTYTIVARDSAGNKSAASATASAKTAADTPPPTNDGDGSHDHLIVGTIRNQRTNRPIARAVIVLEKGSSKRVYIADSKGRYKISGLQHGKYKLTYRAVNYKTTSISVQVLDSYNVKDIKLRKR